MLFRRLESEPYTCSGSISEITPGSDDHKKYAILAISSGRLDALLCILNLQKTKDHPVANLEIPYAYSDNSFDYYKAFAINNALVFGTIDSLVALRLFLGDKYSHLKSPKEDLLRNVRRGEKEYIYALNPNGFSVNYPGELMANNSNNHFGIVPLNWSELVRDLNITDWYMHL